VADRVVKDGCEQQTGRKGPETTTGSLKRAGDQWVQPAQLLIFLAAGRLLVFCDRQLAVYMTAVISVRPLFNHAPCPRGLSTTGRPGVAFLLAKPPQQR
jgi:hypothetical protein